jgi:sugar phosphate isomerase/epimerase
MGKMDEHLCPGQGSLDFTKLLPVCKNSGYNGPFTLELFPYENILRGKEVFLDLWEKS